MTDSRQATSVQAATGGSPGDVVESGRARAVQDRAARPAGIEATSPARV